MVLVDTSVWVRALLNREPYASELQGMLEQQQVAAHALVYGELLMGDTGGRRKILIAYSLLQQLAGQPHPDVVEFVRTRNLAGQGIGWIDAHLLAASYAAKIPFWTADARLRQITEELGIAYHSE